jgi:hypothetical protein
VAIGVTADSTYLYYFGDQGTRGLVRVPLAGGPGEPITSDHAIQRCADLEVRDGYLYCLEGDRIVAVPLVDGLASLPPLEKPPVREPRTISVPPEYGGYLASDARFLYWVDHLDVFRAPLDLGAVETAVCGEAGAAIPQVAADETGVYYAVFRSDGGAVMKLRN